MDLHWSQASKLSKSPMARSQLTVEATSLSPRPAASNDGNLFLPNDGFYTERDTGAAWVPWGPIFPMTVPVSGDYAWFNQGGASVVITNGGIHLSIPSSATTNFRGRTKAKTAPYTITAAFLLNFYPSNFTRAFGLFFTDDTKVHGFGVGFNNTYQLSSTKWTDSTTIDTNYTTTAYQIFSPVLWLRIADDNTNRVSSFSADGINWVVFHSIGRTDHLTATKVGFGGDALNSQVAGLTLLSWKEA